MGAQDITSLVAMLTGQGRDIDMNGRPLPVDPNWLGAFGPGVPILPEPLDQPSEGGQQRPRIWQYAPQTNLLGAQGNKPINWDVLRDAADSPLFRACIQARKDELSTLEWVIAPAASAVERVARQSRRGNADVAAELREKYQDEIDRETEFWTYPDRKNGYDWATWIGMIQEEQLVFDALTIYPRKTYGGDLLDFTVIDGSTVKPLIDEMGGRPEPPNPAYQQILFGFPRGDYTAETIDRDGTKVIPGAFMSDQLVYRRRVPRPRSPYGFSATEQALLDGLLYNSRFRWMIAEYTDGTMPAGFLVNRAGTLDWDARQTLEYEKAYNDQFAGNTAERYRQRLLPPGIEPILMQVPGERYKPDYDLHLIRLVAMHFGINVTELGFIESGGLGSTGFHEGQEDVLFRRTRLPDMRWFSAYITMLGRTHRKMSPDLEFRFLGLEDEDEAAADAVSENRIRSGRRTINEDRALRGEPAYDFPEADMPMIQTARGVVFLKDASKVAPAGTMIEPASEQGPADANADGSTDKPVSPTQRRPVKPANGANKSAEDELRAYQRWVKKASGTRPFRFEHVTKGLADALDLDLTNVEFAKEQVAPGGGGAVPKAASALAKLAGLAGSKTYS